MKALLKYSADGWPVAMDVSGAVTKPASVVVSLTQIYDAYFDFVWRNARRLGVPEDSADDVVQDVFVVIHRRIRDFDGRTQLRAWIFGILVRVARAHHRSFRRKGARCISLDAEAAHGGGALAALAHGETPSESAERAERVRLLKMLLNQLDENKRVLLVLSELEQWTLREIAEFLGSNTNTVHSRLRAAKRSLEKVHARWLADPGKIP